MKKNFTKGDLLIILIIFLLSAPFIFIKSNSKGEVVVRLSGEEKARFSLDGSDDGEYAFRSNRGFNIIEIREGRVRVKEANCPDKLDVKQGWIEDVGESLICLPNRFVCEIEGESDIDGVIR